MRPKTTAALVPLLALAACGGEGGSAAAPVPGTVHEWVLPAPPGSLAPDLQRAPDGRLLLSWLNAQPGRRPAVQFVALNAEGIWQSQPRTVAVGHSLVVDPATAPRVQATADGALWMQWLQQSDEGGKRTLWLVRSRDGGMQWSEPAHVPPANAAASQGSAVLWPAGQDMLGMAWLEGDAAAAATLRGVRMDMNLLAGGQAMLDPSAWTCGQSAAAPGGHGPVLAYRGVADGGVRDVRVVRAQDGGWSAPAPVHADGWAGPSCPQPGPALAAHANEVLVAWYSVADGAPVLRLARSSDGGVSFGAPLQVDGGDAVAGPVAVALDERQAWVAWLRNDPAQGATVQLARYPADLSGAPQQLTVARLQAPAGVSSAVRVAARDGDAWLVWGDVIDGAADLAGARVSGLR